MISFVVPGKPTAKQRARVVFSKGKARSYTPDETVRYENLVKLMAKEAGVQIMEGPVLVEIVITKPVPKSYSKKKAEAVRKQVYATGKPDIDNIGKSIMDGLNGVAWMDDAQVGKMTVSRIWGNHDEVVVALHAIEEK